MPSNTSVVRGLFRAYPFQKGRYRWMMLCERFLTRSGKAQVGVHGRYRFSLDLDAPGLERTFYFFMPERYEHETQDYIVRTVTEGMTVMDIGAHHGLFTLLLARCVGASGKVFSFEPEKDNFAKLDRNVRLNGIGHVEPMRLALSDFCGHTRLVVDASNAGHYLESAAEGTAATALRPLQQIAVETLDSFVERMEISKIDLIKIDAESSEHLILKGAHRTLSRGIAPRIICEAHSSDEESEVGRDRVRNEFYKHGYRSYVLNSKLARRAFLSEIPADEPLTALQNILFLKDGHA